MDTDSFAIHIETEDFCKDIVNDLEKWFDISNYDKNDDRPLPIGKNKKVIGLFKDELGGKIVKVLFGIRAKTWAYLMDDDSEHKRAKKQKKYIIKKDLMVKNYEDCLFNIKIILKSQQVYPYNVYTVKIIKIALSSNDDKRLQIFDRITTYPYGANAFKVCKSEMMIMRDFFVKKYEDCLFYDEIILQS